MQKENVSTGTQVPGMAVLISRVPDTQSDRQLGGKRLLPPHFCHNSLLFQHHQGLLLRAFGEMAFSAVLVVGGGGGESICCTGSFCDFNKTLPPPSNPAL